MSHIRKEQILTRHSWHQSCHFCLENDIFLIVPSSSNWCEKVGSNLDMITLHPGLNKTRQLGTPPFAESCESYGPLGPSGSSSSQRRRTPRARSFRSFRFFKLPTSADTGNCSVQRPSMVLWCKGPLGPLGFEGAHYRQTLRPSSSRDPKQSPASFRSAVKDHEDPAVQCRWLAVSG